MPAAGDTVPTSNIHCASINFLRSLIMRMYNGHLPGVEEHGRAHCSKIGAKETALPRKIRKESGACAAAGLPADAATAESMAR